MSLFASFECVDNEAATFNRWGSSFHLSNVSLPPLFSGISLTVSFVNAPDRIFYLRSVLAENHFELYIYVCACYM